MKSDLQQAAIQKLASITGHAQLSPEKRSYVRNWILKRCREQKNKLANGVNGTNGTGDVNRFIVRPVSQVSLISQDQGGI